MKLHDVRRDYSGDLLPEDLTGFEPWGFFDRWLAEALEQELEATAMQLNTVDERGVPRSRVVLLKDYSPDGLVFYTSHLSAKGRELDAHPATSVTFWWPRLMLSVPGARPRCSSLGGYERGGLVVGLQYLCRWWLWWWSQWGWACSR